MCNFRWPTNRKGHDGAITRIPLIACSGYLPPTLTPNPQSGEQPTWKEVAPGDRTGVFGVQPIQISSDYENDAYEVQFSPSEMNLSDASVSEYIAKPLQYVIVFANKRT